MDTPLEVCEKRDVKGLYKKARAGIIRGESYRRRNIPSHMIECFLTFFTWAKCFPFFMGTELSENMQFGSFQSMEY